MSGPLQGVVVWVTGPPSAGKTTLARGLVDALVRRRVAVLWLDSDDLRSVLTPHPTYSDEDRDAFYGALGHLAIRAAAGRVTVVISATGSRRRYRDRVRGAVPRFAEVALQCDRAALLGRDDKGLYRRAAAGEVTALPGEGAPYEPPLEPELVLDSGVHGPATLVDATCRWLDAWVAEASPRI